MTTRTKQLTEATHRGYWTALIISAMSNALMFDDRHIAGMVLLTVSILVAMYWRYRVE